ncbi:MAG: topoisomerase C-terminal repeat-containing protein, partial [Bullifex sp.]
GLKTLVDSARNERLDAKTLVFPHLSGKSVISGETVNYQIKVGPYGSYLLLDRKREDGKAVMVNLSDTLCPGMMNEDDVSALISSEICPEAAPDDGRTQLKNSRRGQYWQRGDKTCNVPKGKKSAESYTEEEIDFYFSLPKVIARDEEGNDITVNNGPYGGYITYKGSNFKVFGPLTELSSEKALALVQRDGASSKGREYEPVGGKAVSLKKGRYGAYLKWGSSNIALSKDEKARAAELTQEEIEAIIKRHGEEASKPSEGSFRGTYEGKPIEVLKGRFGLYIKCGDKNYRLTKADQDRADSLTEDDLVTIIKAAEERTLPLKDLGTFEEIPVRVLNGRYGAYLKYGDVNIALPAKFKNDLTLLDKEEAVRLIRAKQEKLQ